METYQAMNEQICEMLRTVGHLTEDYAAQRIEELEQETDSWRATTMTHLVRIKELENSLAHCDAEREAAMKLAVEFGGQLENEHQIAKKAEAVLASAIDELQTCRLHNTELERKLDMIEYTSLAQRIAIEELEQQLRDAREAAQAQSETAQHDWLSPAEAEGLRQELREAKADLATMDADRQDDRLSNPHFGTSPRYLVEIQRDRLKDECERLRQELQAAREIVV